MIGGASARTRVLVLLPCVLKPATMLAGMGTDGDLPEHGVSQQSGRARVVPRQRIRLVRIRLGSPPLQQRLNAAMNQRHDPEDLLVAGRGQVKTMAS